MPADRYHWKEGGGADPRLFFAFPGRRAAIVLCLLGAFGSFACRGDATPEASEASETSLREDAVPDSFPDPSDSLRVRLVFPPEVRAGEPVQMTLRVENVTDRALTLYLTGRTIAFDLIVEDAEGAVAWSRLHEQVVPAILRVETLAPHDTLLLSDTWDQRSNDGNPVAPGAYTVRGEVPSEAGPLVAPAVGLRIGGG